ncbi:hypothetical protein C1646_701117 [Rhizophagus diaphanus]|nr:hypothetical protein C1646_701117 [Rhizophagus diaphanus] [Rhizophagus sp. MUCL 43196]
MEFVHLSNMPENHRILSHVKYRQNFFSKIVNVGSWFRGTSPFCDVCVRHMLDLLFFVSFFFIDSKFLIFASNSNIVTPYFLTNSLFSDIIRSLSTVSLHLFFFLISNFVIVSMCFFTFS